MKPCRGVSAGFVLDVRGGFWMLPILAPYLVRRHHGHLEPYLDIEKLVVVEAPVPVRLLYESAHPTCHLTPHHNGGGCGYATEDTRSFIASQEGPEQLWRLDKGVRFDTAFFHKVAKVALPVFRVPRPAEPVKAGSINHASFRM